MSLALFADFNHLAERHRSVHGRIIVIKVIGQSLFGKCLPATHNLGGIIHLQLIVLILEEVLQTATDMRFLNRQHDDLVINQKAALDGFGKTQRVKDGAVEFFVIHRTDGDVVLLRVCFGAISVDARSRGHVHPLAGANERCIVNLNEGTFIFALECCASCAVRLITNDEIELGERVLLLRFADDINGVIR